MEWSLSSHISTITYMARSYRDLTFISGLEARSAEGAVPEKDLWPSGDRALHGFPAQEQY
jgi:hypothetical protein